MGTVYWNPGKPRYRLRFWQDGEFRAGVWWPWRGEEDLYLNTQILSALNLGTREGWNFAFYDVEVEE